MASLSQLAAIVEAGESVKRLRRQIAHWRELSSNHLSSLHEQLAAAEAKLNALTAALDRGANSARVKVEAGG